MNKIENISSIILDGVNEGKSYEEINAALAEAGSSLVLGEDKPGNALLSVGVGSPEPCEVLDGKLVHGCAVPHQDYVYYGGRTYQVDDDGKTLIEVAE